MQINLQADSGGRPWAPAGVVWPGGTFVPESVFSGAPLCAEVTATAAARALRGLRSADAARCAQPSGTKCRFKEQINRRVGSNVEVLFSKHWMTF